MNLATTGVATAGEYLLNQLARQFPEEWVDDDRAIAEVRRSSKLPDYGNPLGYTPRNVLDRLVAVGWVELRGGDSRRRRQYRRALNVPQVLSPADVGPGSEAFNAQLRLLHEREMEEARREAASQQYQNPMYLQLRAQFQAFLQQLGPDFVRQLLKDEYGLRPIKEGTDEAAA